MNVILVPKYTVVHSIPIGRRISEIMKERGSAFSQQAVSRRIGINRETVRLMLTGEREIFNYELEKFAIDLKLSCDRILQLDIRKEWDQINKLLEAKVHLSEAVEIAKQVLDKAIGITEKSQSLFTLAHIFYEMRKYDDAHTALLRAYEYAEKVAEKYNDTELLDEILGKLIVTFTIRKEYSKLLDIFEKIDSKFLISPKRQGEVYFSKAMIAEHFGKLGETRTYLQQSIHAYQTGNFKTHAGRAFMSLGYFEFKAENYKESKQNHILAIEHLEGDFYKFIAIKEYAKTLIKLGECNEAIQILESTLTKIDDPDLKGKYLLLLSVAKDDVSFADLILSIPKVWAKVVRLACMFLIKHYTQKGDAESLLKYSIIAEGFSINQSDIIREEDL